MAFRRSRLGLFGGLILIVSAQQAAATDIVLRGPNGRVDPISRTTVVATDGTTKSGGSGGKSVVNLTGTPAGQEQIVIVGGTDGRLAAVSIRGAPGTVEIDSRNMIAIGDTFNLLFVGDQLAATEEAIKACDRAAYDAALARLENFRLLHQADLWEAEAALGPPSRALGIPPQHSAKDFDKLIKSAESAAAGGFGDPGRVSQLKAAANTYLPLVRRYETAAYQLEQVANARARIKAFPEPCDRKVGFLDTGGSDGFGVSFGLGRAQYDFPNYKAYSLESMGSFLRTDIVDTDRDESALEIFGSAYFYIPGTETALRIGGRFTDLSSKLKLGLQIMPMMGERFDIPTPGGGFFTTSQVDRFRVEQEFRQYQVHFQFERTFDLGGATVKPYGGVNLSFINSDDTSRFKIAGNFARFEEWRTLDTFGAGPILGAEVEVPIEGGVYGFGGVSGELRWNSSKAKWKTQLDVTGNPSDKQSTSRSDKRLSWGGMGSLGVGYRGMGVDIRLFGTAGLSNHYPHLEIESDVGDGDPDIAWDNTVTWALRLELGLNF